MHKSILSLLILLLFSLNLSAQCNIGDLEVTRSQCNVDGFFNVTLDFTYSNPEANGFRVQGNGMNHGEYAYNDLPITISNLSGNCETEWEFVVRDLEDLECSNFIEYGVVCCSQNCDIEIVNFGIGECQNGGFNGELDVEVDQNTTETTAVYFNGNILDYYELESYPLLLEDLVPQANVENSIIVCAEGESDLICCDTIVFESPCDCKISNLQHRIVECDDENSEYYLDINFEYRVVSDSFLFGGNGNFWGNFAYDQLPHTIGPIPFSSDTTTYLIVDEKNNFCFNELVVPPVTECDTMCSLSNVVVEVNECEEDNVFYATLSFDANAHGVEGFSVRGNHTVYEEDLLYGEESYEIGPINADCSTYYEFFIRDNQLSDCFVEIGLDEPVCCGPCELDDLIVDYTCLDGEVTDLTISFDYYNTLDSSFLVVINEDTVGPYGVVSLPLTIDYNQNSDEEIRVEIIFGSDQLCTIVKELIPECDPHSCPEYFGFEYDYGMCNDDNHYYVLISFQYEGMVGDSFFVMANNEEYGPFKYGQNLYEVGPIVEGCEPFEFVIIDGDNQDCFQAFLLEDTPCCSDCEIVDQYIEPICENGMVIGLSFYAENIGDNDNYSLIIGPEVFGPFSYGLEHNLGFALADGLYIGEFVDSENESCSSIYSFEVGCDPIDCEINEMQVETLHCTPDSFRFKIDFDHNREDDDLFELYINDEFIATLSYSFLPFLTGVLPRGEGPWVIEVVDVENQNCGVDVFIQEELCESSINDQFFGSIILKLNDGILFYENQQLNDHRIDVYNLLGQNVFSESISNKQKHIQYDMSKHLHQVLIVHLTDGIHSKSIKMYVK